MVNGQADLLRRGEKSRGGLEHPCTGLGGNPVPGDGEQPGAPERRYQLSTDEPPGLRVAVIPRAHVDLLESPG